MIISFAETIEALLDGRKTCTRRSWRSIHADKFYAGQMVDAYNKNPRNGGKPVAIIRILRSPYLSADLPDSDWEAEGFAYMSEHGLTLFGGKTPEEVWSEWSKPYGMAGLWVVRFELASSIQN